jgi:hypothetical protein
MKQNTQKIVTHMAIGALISIIILYAMGRLKTETYEAIDSDQADAELTALLKELDDDEM